MGRPRGARKGGESAGPSGALDRPRPGALACLPARARAAHAAGSGRPGSGSSPRARPGGVGVRGPGWDPSSGLLSSPREETEGGEGTGPGVERGSPRGLPGHAGGSPRPGAAPRPRARLLEAEGRTAGASGPRAPGAGFVGPPPRSRPDPARRRGSRGRGVPCARDARPGTAGAGTGRPPRAQGDPRSVDNGEFPPPEQQVSGVLEVGARSPEGRAGGFPLLCSGAGSGMWS